MAAKIHTNDEVIILTGKNKGKRGKIISILKDLRKVVIKDINFVKKHQKPLSSANKLGSIIKKEAAIDVSNIAIFNKHSNKADHVIFKIDNGKKIRIFKSDGKIIK